MDFLLPYFSIPIFMMLIWRTWNLPAKGLSFLITILLLALYPSVLSEIDNYYHPMPQTGGICLMFDTIITLAHFVIMMPLTLAFQLILFAVFVKERADTK